MNNKLNPVKIPELLAPAGTLESALTAFENGADAVYAGLGRFNAREMGENFSEDDMSRLSSYTKKAGRRFYITLNTLIKENELEELGAVLNRIIRIKPDAVIVQDIGVARFIRECFPELDIHGSTQMAIHNSRGVEEAALMGLKRVILERQVSLSEMELILKKAPVEIEVFIHGSLCCSLSGQCLLSSWLGGYSGNRGKCKQPCRRIYQENGKSGYYLSPGDLSGADLIDFFIENRVSSLKIEGRLKRGDYLQKVISSYRKILDSFTESSAKDRKEILKENTTALSRAYARELTHGFYIPEEIPTLIKYSSSGFSGKYAGEITSAGKGFFEVKLKDRLHLGDRIRVYREKSDEKNIITVTEMFSGGRRVKSAVRGTNVRILSNRKIPAGGQVFKIGETVAAKTNTNSLPLFLQHTDIDLEISVNDKSVKVTSFCSKKAGTWEYPAVFEKAEKRPLCEEDLINQFRSTGSEAVQAGKVSAVIEGSYFIPASIQKKIKREFWEWALQYYSAELETITADTDINLFLEKCRREGERENSRKYLTVSVSENSPPFTDTEERETVFSSSADYFLEKGSFKNFQIEEVILPHFCSEHDLERLEADIDNCYTKGIRKFRLTSLFQLPLLDKYPDIEKTVSYPFPVTNSAAVLQLKSRGINRIQGWIELDRNSHEKLAASSLLDFEIYTSGLPFLFATRAEIKAEKSLKDSRNNLFYIKRDSNRKITYLYPDSLIKLEKDSRYSWFIDLSEKSFGSEESFNGFNYDKIFF